MGDATITNRWWQLLAAALAGALLVLSGAIGYKLFIAGGPSTSGDAQADSASATPGMDYIEAYRCTPGLTKIVLVRGKEDNFSREGDEPALMRKALLKNGYYQSLAGQNNHPEQTRDYDQTGVDRHLVDHFNVPRDVIAGQLVVSLRQLPSAPNDAVVLGDLDISERPSHPNGSNVFYAPIGRMAENEDPVGDMLEGLYKLDLEVFVPGVANPFEGTFGEYLNLRERPDGVDFNVAEDTLVDFAALVMCQEPQEARGTTLREFRVKLAAPDVSFLTCLDDRLVPSCNPFSGDQVCSKPAAIACYKEGHNAPTSKIAKNGSLQSSFVGGEVKLSTPIIADQFSTRDAADAYCASEFGNGWRTLGFHEAGGQRVTSISNIPPLSRAIVHVEGQPYANCWDRPESVVE